MKRVRIGNDIVVTWAITKDGQPYSLDGLNKTLYIKNAFGKTEIKEYTTEENKIVWTFLGKDQKHTGKYSLELVINEGVEGMATTDVCDFVYLTPITPCCAGDDDEEVITESIELDSSMAFAPNVIGGGGLQYAIERTVYPTRIEVVDLEPTEAEITEEERAYNKETYRLAYEALDVFVIFLGALFNLIATDNDEAVFNVVCHIDNWYDYDGLYSFSVTVTKEGDAVCVVKKVETGSAPSAPRDMNNDFSKDF